MPQRLYLLDKDQKQILGLTWKGKYKNLELRLNNKPLGKIENRQELIQGKEFEISHDKKLSVKLVREMYLFTELEILVNGFPVEKSMTHPVKKLNDVFLLVMFIAAVNLITGLLGLVTDAAVFEELGMGFWNIIYTGIFIILGIMIRERKSMFAMISVIVFMVLDIILSLLFMTDLPKAVHLSAPLLVKVFLTIFLFRGISAIKAYRKTEHEKDSLEKAEEEKKRQTPLSQQITEDHSKFMPGDHSAYMPGSNSD
jgi:hypothetical protein